MKLNFRTADDKDSTFNQSYSNFADAFSAYINAVAWEDCESELLIEVIDDDEEILLEEAIIHERISKGKYSSFKY